MNFPTTYRELVASSRDSIEFEHGSALALGYALGVTASHCDTLDYRAMLVRELTNGCSPLGVLRGELDGHRLHRELIEAHKGPLA